MRGAVVKSHFWLRGPNRVRERTSAGHDNDVPGAAVRDRVEPAAQMTREGKAAAELDDSELALGAHSLGRVRTRGPAGYGIELIDVRDFRLALAPDLDAHGTRPDIELLDAHGDVDHARMHQEK